ncbi:MAG: Rid family detoxifying hydrolase [Proteobacteria bacterium]|nr:Rid family detoxifying hydrolase [Pseudomonadota bacterium]
MKKIVQTSKAPEVIGTYSQAVIHQGLIYVSGQIPINPATGKMLENNFVKQAEQVFKNLSAVAEAAGSSLQNILKLNVYMLDLENFAHINEVMSAYIVAPYPARAAVQVSRLPKDALIEIDAVIAVP